MPDQPFIDPNGRQGTIIFGLADDAKSGIRHDGCDTLADVSPELDAAFCPTCHWQCRISGAWYSELLAATREALANASTEPLKDQWKAERDRAAAVMGQDFLDLMWRNAKAIQAGLAAVQRLLGTARTEPAGMAYIVGAIDAARAQANWTPWWLEPVIRTELSIGDKCPCCGEEWTGA